MTEASATFDLKTLILLFTVALQLLGLGGALGALRMTIKSLREIVDSLNGRLKEVEGKTNRLDVRTSKIEAICEMRHLTEE